MSYELTAYAEHRVRGHWFPVSRDGVVLANEEGNPARVWDGQYNLFGWLANLRNSRQVPQVIALRGLPDDLSVQVAELAARARERGADVGHSWIGLNELLDFDYDATFADQRNKGEQTPYRDLFNVEFWEDLAALQTQGKPEDVRVVFWFD